ncbi:DUF305 domain-containing protein [Bosea sp. AS-1]|uniref:CopM family metallochaperone n=1 Tax=Bosea sp. AS-1 TaxID=2015316 RepID=UPI000B78B59A|nr:DUF305 domain-containing protein [Bosea sp. AS-1]
MNLFRTSLAALALAAVFAGPALAQHQGHGGGTMKMDGASTDNASTKAFKEANGKMHKDMDITYSGDADADFVRGMIPHHQGAIDMAKVVLAHGKDPEIRKLAEAVIRDQEKEVAQMREWLKKNGK